MEGINNKNEIPCAIYTCGLANEGLCDSVLDQHNSCMEYIISHAHEGLVFSKSYSDLSVLDDNRPDFNQMLEDIKKVKIKAIVVYRQDILFSSKIDSCELYKFLYKNGIDIKCVKYNIDFSINSNKSRTNLDLILSFNKLKKEMTKNV